MPPRVAGWVDNAVGYLAAGVSEPVLEQAFDDWKQIDQTIGTRIGNGVRDKLGG